MFEEEDDDVDDIQKLFYSKQTNEDGEVDDIQIDDELLEDDDELLEDQIE